MTRRDLLAGFAGSAVAASVPTPSAWSAVPQSSGPSQTDVYVAGRDGYHTYRIPAPVLTTRNTLLAFCEGRKNNRRDHGDIDLVLKRSTDGGKTWSPQQIVYEEGGAAEITIGNPAPAVDRDTGTIWLPFCRDNDRVLITHSDDDGLSWARPIDITEDVKESGWTWYATGPVNGIQLRNPDYKGRLVVPCDHRVGGAENPWNHAGRSHVIYSDDHGRSWQLSKPTDFAMNECTVVERVDGALLLNMRSYRGRNRRAVATSTDGGVTWSHSKDHPKLIEPVCQASMVRYTWPEEYGRSRILFSNPASTTRDHMTVRLSYDEGKTWPVSRVLHEGPAAYSGLCALPDMSIGNLYERGGEHPYEKITFARFKLDWLTRGKDRVTG